LNSFNFWLSEGSFNLFYWALGQYDGVIIFETPSEKDAVKLAIEMKEDVTTETMVAIPREKALKLL
jgi:uncharacterized protein with GYD domain